MRPLMEVEAILGDVEEALAAYPSFGGRDVRTLAVIIATIHESGASLGDGGFALIERRVACRWQLRWEKAEAGDALTKGAPFEHYVIDTRRSCQQAARTFEGREFRQPHSLPALPLRDCGSAWCNCGYKGVRRRQADIARRNDTKSV